MSHNVVAQSWSNGYAYRRPIAINHAKVPNTDQTNFPVLFAGTYSDLATTSNGGAVTNSNGYDIIFTSDAAGSTILPFEREIYSPTTGQVEYWVNVPTVSTSGDTVIYMFYGNSSVTTDQSNKTGVWSSSYSGVWHLPNGSSLTATDSTSFGNNGTVSSATAAPGVIDGAASFSSSGSQYISVPDNSSLKPTNLTFSFWMKRSGSQAQYAHVVEKGAGASAPWGSYFLQLSDAGDASEGTLCIGTTDGVCNGVSYPSGSFADGTWNFVAGTFDSSSKTFAGYLNGQLESTGTAAVGTILYDTTGLYFGRQITYGQYFNGELDEVRISSTARSADWVATEYNNQSSPSTFCTVGSAVGGAGSSGPTITAAALSGSGPYTVTLTGLNFGTSQGSSTLTLNGVGVTPTSWSGTSIAAQVPFGLTSNIVTATVTVAGASSNSVSVTIPLPGSWADTDIGLTGQMGSGGYATGVFSVAGAGSQIWSTADQFNYTYQSLSGDGTIIARVLTLGGGPYAQAGVMIRETLTPGSTNAYVFYANTAQAYFDYRTSTGASTGRASTSFSAIPTWVKLVRSGSSFSGYTSPDGINWTQIGSTQTISMATNVYIGLAVGSANLTQLAPATFDNVSISSSAVSPPVISSISPAEGTIGTQVVISGSGFGSSQGTSAVLLNDVPMTINSWSSTSINLTVAPQSASGPMAVALASAMNDSNPLVFTVLPTTWSDGDIGTVGIAGSSSYTGGVYTVQGAGSQIWSTADQFNYTYQPLSGNGTIIARVVSLTGGSSTYAEAGVMIRETLTTGSANAFVFYQNTHQINFNYRTTTSGSTGQGSITSISLPYWVKLVRVGNLFAGYASPDGVTWTQVGTTQTFSMATNVYVGLAVGASNSSLLATATFDNVSLSIPFPTVGTLSGTVTRASDSSAVSGANVKALQFGTVKALGVTNSAGEYEILNLPVGNYDVQTSATGLGTSLTTGEFIQGDATTTLNVSLSSPGTISGTVYQSNGVTAIPYANVQAFIGNSLFATASADGSGNYSLSGLSSGTYTVVATATGYVAGNQSETVSAGATVTANFSLQAQSTGATSYVYDSIGRLVGVIQPSGDSAIYNYDAVGNLLSISRQSASQLTIITFTATSGSVGTAVTIYGTGFSSVASLNTVKFNGTTATIQSATPTQIIAIVPAGATTGTISVTTSAGTVTSSSSFTVH